MNQVTLLYRLAKMRHSAGAGPVQSVRWAAGLVWRNGRTK